jgi:putative two-component system response regulator
MTSKILLVDDEARILDVLSCMLRELGCNIKTASGPVEALDLVGREKFHMAFVDNLLGPVEGIDLIGQLGKIDPDLHFVIMTGNPNIETAIHALKKGVSDFLRKPFHVEDLLVSIDHVNRKRELEQQRREMMSGLELKVQEKTAELKQTYLSVLVALSRAVEKKDLGTYGHSVRVGDISARIAATLAFSPEAVEDIRAASLLHDIGKIGISDFILAKKGPLSMEEEAIIKSHPEKGVEILKPLMQFASILPAILYHHERYDGTGYPAGLSGESIPLAARIIAVADTYDAILSDRPYRAAGTIEKAVAELKTCAGTQFDPLVVDTFTAVAENRVEVVG